MPEIVFPGGGGPASDGKSKRVIAAEEGDSLLDAALSAGILIYHTCGGNASCSTCRVVILQGAEYLSPIEEAESEVMDAFDLKSPCRLSCQARIFGGRVEVEIPRWERTPRPNKTPKVP